MRGVKGLFAEPSAASASSRTPDVKCRPYAVFDGDSRRIVLPSWRGRHCDDPEIHSSGRVKGRCEDETLGPVGHFFWNQTVCFGLGKFSYSFPGARGDRSLTFDRTDRS